MDEKDWIELVRQLTRDVRDARNEADVRLALYSEAVEEVKNFKAKAEALQEKLDYMDMIGGKDGD